MCGLSIYFIIALFLNVFKSKNAAKYANFVIVIFVLVVDFVK